MATPAMADTIDLATYRARLEAAREILAFALTLEPTARTSFVDKAAEMLRQTTGLRTADGSAVPVDDARIADRLATNDAAIDRAIADLDALIGATLRGPALDPEAAEAQLRQRVGEHRAGAAEMTLVQLISLWLARFLADLRGTPPDPRIVLTIAGGLGLALLLAILGIMGRDLRERFRREVILPELRQAGGPDPAAHLRAADEALRAGAMRDAIHALYLYAIAALASREAIRYDPSLTDRELLARASSIPNAAALRDLVQIHDRIWYGLRDARAEDAARARQLADRAAA